MLSRFFGLPMFFSLPGACTRELRLHAGVISAGSCKQEELRLHAGVGTKVACRSNFSTRMQHAVRFSGPVEQAASCVHAGS